MDLVDTHCHIQSIGLKEGERTTREMWAKMPDRTAAQVVADAARHGVTKIICVGCDSADSKLAVEFAAQHEGCWASIGIHPHEAQYHGPGNGEKVINFASLVHSDKVVAIGECGLDYYYEHSPRKDQIQILEMQMELALAANLPMIFHVREAFNDFWPIFDSYKGIRGVLHSYTDNAVNLAKAIDRGLYVGVNGIATFAKDPAQIEVYKSIPIDHLLLETDAPFLTPVPYRGSINEPQRLGVIADFMSQLRSEDRAKLAAATSSNARDLFGI